MTEDIINAMKELIRCYEICNDTNNAVGREITYWRERFLKDADLPNDPEKSTRIWNVFLYLPSPDFMFHAPEKHIQAITKLTDEN